MSNAFHAAVYYGALALFATSPAWFFAIALWVRPAEPARPFQCTPNQHEAGECEPVTIDPRCNGPARYDAMREAFEAGRPNPC